MAIAAVLLTLVNEPEGRARAVAALAATAGVTLGPDERRPRLPATLEADPDPALEPLFASLARVPGVLDVSLVSAWLERDAEAEGQR